jgi:hypothetical protein
MLAWISPIRSYAAQLYTPTIDKCGYRVLFRGESGGIIVGGWTTVRPYIFVEKGRTMVLARADVDDNSSSVAARGQSTLSRGTTIGLRKLLSD